MCEVHPFKCNHYCKYVVMTFSVSEPKPSCQIGRKHYECWNINQNRRCQESEPTLEELLNMVAKNSTNNGGVTATDDREIKQFSRVAAVNDRKISQFW